MRQGLARVLIQPFAFDRRHLHQSARGGTSARRRARAKVLYCDVEKRREAPTQSSRTERLSNRADIFIGIPLIGAEKQRLLAAKGIVETAALDARVTCDVRERRPTHAFTPKLIECDA